MLLGKKLQEHVLSNVTKVILYEMRSFENGRKAISLNENRTQNLVCENLQGKVLWKAELPSNDADDYIALRMVDGKILEKIFTK